MIDSATVYGLDFTSSPSRKDSVGKSAKRLTLATCVLSGTTLRVVDLNPLNAEKANDFSEYRTWLSTSGRWIAGIDFSFGMPFAAINHFGWLASKASGTWEDYIRCLYEKLTDMGDFEDAIENWTYANEISEAGNPIKIQPKRIVDQLAHSQSPLKINDNPHPGKMFYRGCKALVDSSVSIPPLRCPIESDSDRVVIEAYPRLVAQRFLPNHAAFTKLLDEITELESFKIKVTSHGDDDKKRINDQLAYKRTRLREMLRYKESQSDEARENRKRVIDGLSRENPYGIKLEVGDFHYASIDDFKGDVLDSVLCAVQAAWGHLHRHSNYGIPTFQKDQLLKNVVSLEGWIVDPTLLHFDNHGGR